MVRAKSGEKKKMGKLEEIYDIISKYFTKDRLSRGLGQWSTVLQFQLDTEKTFYVIVNQGNFEVQQGIYPNPKTVVSGDISALKELLNGVVDVTHFIANGKLRLIRGDYFDLLNLSRAAFIVKR
jgi:putative sterol carrier protein